MDHEENGICLHLSASASGTCGGRQVASVLHIRDQQSDRWLQPGLQQRNIFGEIYLRANTAGGRDRCRWARGAAIWEPRAVPLGPLALGAPGTGRHGRPLHKVSQGLDSKIREFA